MMFPKDQLDVCRTNPLTHHLVLQTRDMEEAASWLAMSAVPYRSQLLGPKAHFSTQIFGGESPRMHLSWVRTTGAMRVQAELPADSYAMVLGISGELEHRVAGELVCVCPECSLLQSPSQPVEVQTPERFELLFLRFSRESLICEIEKMMMRGINTPLVFSPCFKLGTEAGQRFRQLLSSLCTILEWDGKQDGEHRLAAQAIENDLVNLLLQAQRHNYSRLLARRHDAGPWQVRAAEEYIRANAHLALSLGDICMAAGVSVRTLQHSFQRARGYSPMQFLRRVRLEGAHADLSLPGDETTVTQAASRWGFLHFGRFAREYQVRFGEKPSATLQRSRARS